MSNNPQYNTRKLLELFDTTNDRRPMAEFEYLKNEIKPSTGIMVFFSILGVFLGIGMAFLFRAVDVFGRESPPWR